MNSPYSIRHKMTSGLGNAINHCNLSLETLHLCSARYWDIQPVQPGGGISDSSHPEL
ncbi:unnamed protein product [Staurois parvus]|uniref:Uncharacterized protein n=1 Tax=Staurois parvus TaxID=386267 RepID=A0ABN9AVC9_9NEOB|nr:unnamed protein product [Staurois parvus]